MSNTALLGSYGAQDSSSLMFRNRIINGGMDVWQRATSASGVGVGSVTNANGYIAADRWWSQAFPGTGGSGTSNISMSRQSFTVGQTTVPGEPAFFMRFNASAVGTQGGVNSIIRTVQRIEGVRTLAGQTATLSFWAKADSARTYAVVLTQNFGTGGSPSSLTFAGQATFSVTSSWQYITLTFNIPSISGKTVGTDGNDFLDVNFILYKQDNSLLGDTLGPIGAWSTTPYLDLALVQLEAGPTATPFERRPYSVELQMCQRYYQVHHSGTNSLIPSSYQTSTSVESSGIGYIVTMRDPGSVGLDVAISSGISAQNYVGTVIGTATSAIIVANARSGSQFRIALSGSGFNSEAKYIYLGTNVLRLTNEL